mgnify:CR=1 FL=1
MGRWYGPYVVTTANDNGTYHLAELDGTRLAVPVPGKQIKAFKKRHEDEPDPGSEDDDERMAGRRASNERELVFSDNCPSLAHTGGCAVWWGWMS